MPLDRRTLLLSAVTVAAVGGCTTAQQPARTSGASGAPNNGLLVDLDRGPDEIIALWPNGAPGGDNVTVVEEVVHRDNAYGLVDRAAHNVTTPTLSRFDAQDPDGSALLIIPGGGYSWVVIDKEGFEGARWFNRRGVTVYVLSHRLPHQGWAAGPDTPLQDAQRAMRVIRARAAGDGVDPGRLGVMGFSAGGHVAGSLATRFNADVYAGVDGADALSARPDAAALVYPVATMHDAHVHAGSRRNLLGEEPSAADIAAYSLETDPPANTPPTFLLHATDDLSVPVENSLGMFTALKAKNVPVEMHIFQTGGHGFGLRGLDTNTARAWPQLYLNWAATHGLNNAERLTS